MTVTEMWKPIASLSTEDAKDVELRMSGGNIEVGHFSPVQRRWQIRTGNYSRDHEQQPGVTVHGQIYKLVEGVFPTHWRPLSSPRRARITQPYTETRMAEIVEGHPIWEAIDMGGGQTCDVSGVIRELERSGFSIVSEPNVARAHLDSALIQEILDLLNPLQSSVDRQIGSQLTDERELDAPDDREYELTITALFEHNLTHAICILERRLRDFNPPTSA